MNKTLVWTLNESPELPTRQVTVLSSNDFINTILPLVTVSYVRAEVHLSVSTGSFRHTCVHTHTHTHAHISPQHLHTPGNTNTPPQTQPTYMRALTCPHAFPTSLLKSTSHCASWAQGGERSCKTSRGPSPGHFRVCLDCPDSQAYSSPSPLHRPYSLQPTLCTYHCQSLLPLPLSRCIFLAQNSS